MSTFRCVIFDLDGVLVDSYECWRKLIDEGLAKVDRPPLAKAEFDAGWGQGLSADQSMFFPQWTLQQVIDFYNTRFAHYARFVHAEEGALAVLQRLREQGIVLAVGSNSPKEVVRLLLAETRLLSLLDYYAGADQVANAKPEPDLLLHIMEHLGLARDQVCYVGDSRFDEQASLAARVFFVGYKRSGQTRIDHLSEVFKVVG